MRLNIEHTRNIATVLLAIALVVALLYLLQTVLVPLIIAVLIAFLLHPAYAKLIKWRCPRLLAAGLCIFVTLIFSLGVAALLVWQMSGFIKDIDMLKANVNNALDSILAWVEDKTSYDRGAQLTMVKEQGKNLVGNFGQYFITALNGTASFLVNATLVAIYTFLLLIYEEKFNNVLNMLIKDEGKKASVKKMIADVSVVSKQFLKGTLIDVVIVATLCTVGFLIIGLEHAFFLGMLVALLNIIPYVGATLGALIPILVGLIYSGDWKVVVGAAAVCLVVQFIDNNIVMPKVVGSSVSLNPLFSTIALILGFMLWGIPGAILSIPLMGIFKVVCDHVEELKPYGYLFSGKR